MKLFNTSDIHSVTQCQRNKKILELTAFRSDIFLSAQPKMTINVFYVTNQKKVQHKNWITSHATIQRRRATLTSFKHIKHFWILFHVEVWRPNCSWHSSIVSMSVSHVWGEPHWDTAWSQRGHPRWLALEDDSYNSIHPWKLTIRVTARLV